MEHTDARRNFSGNIRHLRGKHRLTLSEMASIMSISVSTLRRLESNEPRVKVHYVMLNRVCDYFGISADVMLRERLEEMEEWS